MARRPARRLAAAALLGIAGLGLAVALLAAPHLDEIVEHRALTALRAVLPPPVDLRVADIGWSGIELSDVALGPTLSIPRLRVAWSPIGLLLRRIDAVDIDHPVLTGRWSPETGLDLGGPAAEDGDRTTTGIASAWRLGYLEVREATLDVETPLGPVKVLSRFRAGGSLPDDADFGLVAWLERGGDTVGLSAKGVWTGQLESLKADGRVQIAVDRLDLPGLLARGSMHGPVALDIGEGRLRLSIRQPLQVAGLPEGLPVDLAAPLRLTFRPSDNHLMEINLHTFESKADMRASLSPATGSIAGRKVEAELPDLRASGVWSPTDGLADARLDIEAARLALPDERMEVGGLSATLRGGAKPSLFIDRGEVRHPLLAPLRLSARASLDGPTLSFRGRLADRSGGLSIGLLGSHRDGRGSASLTLGPVAYRPGGTQPADHLPSLADLLGPCEGKLAVRGEARWSPKSLTGEARIEAGGLVADVAGLRLEGLNARARLLADGGIRLESAMLGIAGGTLSAGPMDFDPASGRAEGTLRLDGLELGRLLALLDLPGADGSGRLDGSIPISLGPDGLTVRDGRLRTRAPGRLAYDPPEPPDALRQGGEGASLMREALRDFHFDSLRLEIDRREARDWIASLHLEGANPNLMNGHPFVFAINVSGALDALLGEGLAAWRLPEEVGRALGSREAGNRGKGAKP